MNASKTFALDHVYADNGTYTITVEVTDDDGGSGTETFAVTVDNVAPVVSLSGPTNVDEGSPYIGSGLFIDPGADTWTATVDYGDGTGSQPLTLNANKTFALDHVYADNGTYTITVEVTDDDGGSGTETFAVTVDNVAPVVSLSGPTNVDEGSPYIGSGSFTDPGSDTWTATVDYGDGTGSQPLTLNANKSFTLDHVYADNGIYTITVEVTDDDGGSGTETFAVTVDNVAPVVGLSGPTNVDEEARTSVPVRSPTPVPTPGRPPSTTATALVPSR